MIELIEFGNPTPALAIAYPSEFEALANVLRRIKATDDDCDNDIVFSSSEYECLEAAIRFGLIPGNMTAETVTVVWATAGDGYPPFDSVLRYRVV